MINHYDLNQYMHKIKCKVCKEWFKPYHTVDPNWDQHCCPACNEFMTEGLYL